MGRPSKYPPDPGQPLTAHLIELRSRLMRILLAILIVFLLMFPFANELYALLAQPLLKHLPEGASMIATEVASPFLAPFKFTLVLSFFLAIPMVLYQVWAFIAPGLYREERRLVLPLLFSSTLLFYAGMAFAYFVVFPLVFSFLISVAPVGVTVMTDISKYLEFVLKLFFAFGLAFEVPIATIVLVWTGVTTPASLVAKRPYVIVGAFVIGMLLTPPDMISQTLLAIPMWLLFEAGIIFSRFFVPAADDSADETDVSEDLSVSDDKKSSDNP
jgi:sec-independent protein translocase protein TatC